VQIVCAIYEAMQHGLARTRSRTSKPGASRQPSASSVVAEELQALGIKGFNELSVEQIWDRFKRRAAPEFMPEGKRPTIKASI
jgi:hypothetical protein